MVERERETHMATILRDGRAVTIRPLDEEDHAALLAFGRALPHADLLHLENDFTSPETIARLVNARFAENWRQLVVSIDDLIIGYSVVRRLPGWMRHVAEVGLIVGAGWRRYGLGTALAQSICDAARDLRVDKLIVEMLEEQSAGRAIFERLGFRVEGRFGCHVRDRQGQCHNLIVMAYHAQCDPLPSVRDGYDLISS
jgi:RimJ/RimL family protein N-acetyltransferase